MNSWKKRWSTARFGISLPTKAHNEGEFTLRVGVDLRCLADGKLRGISRYTIELLNALARRPGLAIAGLSDRPLPFAVPVPVESFAAGREVLAEQATEALLCRRLKLDVLLCPANRGLPLFAPVPTVLTLHDAVEWDKELVRQASGKSRLRFSYASVSSLASASRVITVSDASARAIESRLSVDPQRIRVIYEGAGAGFRVGLPASELSAIAATYGLAPGYVLYVGGFDKKKDVATLIRAYSQLDSERRPKLVLAGTSSEEVVGLKLLAEKLRVSDDIEWLGFVDDAILPALYSLATCFVFPAVAEGFGLPVVEAMATGTPVLAAAAASLPEVVGDGGQLFEPGDDAALAGLLFALINNDGSLKRWSTASRARAQQFSWDRAAEETDLVLREAAALKMSEIALQRIKGLGRWRQRR